MKPLDEKSFEELECAYRRYLHAPSGGGSDWDGGGNPHRMMEDDEERRAWAAFCNLCDAKGITTEEFKDMLRRAGKI